MKRRRNRRRSPDDILRTNLKHRYGITPEEKDQMLADQLFTCALCGSDSPKHKAGWVVDHCHDSKVVRGLLCHSCNLALGHAKDNPDLLRAMADYIEKFK